jgi:uncharacterized membrane protein YphA (DoxX/SURF4 family)
MADGEENLRSITLRILMGVYFVYAGGMKIFVSGLDRFNVDLENYRMIEGDFAIVAAYLLPWTEVVAGMCFMLGILRREHGWRCWDWCLLLPLP